MSNSSSTSALNALYVKDSVVGTPNQKRQCTKPKCVRSIERQLPPIHQPNPKDEEAWNVKSLPTNCVPVSKPSRVIENLMKKRQAQHEAAINQVQAQFVTINLDVEAQIRLNSEMLKRDFVDFETETRMCIERLDVDPKEMLAIKKENFVGETEIVLKLHKERVTKIENFYAFLQKLEKSRANQVKKVLKSAYQELHKISYELPYEIQKYFEHEILEINQVTLSNLRCYADLHLKLNLQAENTNRLFMHKIEAVKAIWRDIKKRDVLMQLNEQKLMKPDCEELLLKTEQGMNADSSFVAKEHNMKEMLTHISPLPITSKQVNVWSKCMQDTVNGLDSCARKLITLYRMAVLTVFNGYFDELQTVTENMLQLGLVNSSSEVSVLSLDVCQPAIESVTRQYSDDLFNLEVLWDSIIATLHMKLQTTYMFLHGAAHLWDNHYQRTAEAKRIVLKDLNNVIEKNNKATQDQEIKLNIALDQLRQASSEIVLEDALDDVNSILDNLQKAYSSQYGAEVKTVDKYNTLVAMEIEVLVAELTLFLHVHPKNNDINPTVQKKRASQSNLTDTVRKILPQQMKQCEYQVAAVENWMFGLWEAIEKYVYTCKDEIVQQAQTWISERMKQLAKRLEVKMAFHTSRYSRIKINVYDIRLAELKRHVGRVARHKAGAEKGIENIRHTYYVYESEYADLIESYYEKIKIIQSKMQKAKNSTTSKANISELRYNTSLCNQKITDIIEQQETKYNLILYRVRKTAVEFTKQMKLFLEEGNFNCDEAKLITKDLKSFEKTIKKKYTAIKKEILAKEKKIVAQVQKLEAECLQSLDSSLQEFEFYEKANNRIKSLQAEIRTEVYNIKFLNKKLGNSFNEMGSNRLLNLGSVAHLEQFVGDFNDFTSAMIEVGRNLYQEEPVINANKHYLKNLNQSAQENAFINYVDLLFEQIPMENDSLMAKICGYLKTSLTLIQSEAEEFYGNHGEIKNKGNIQPTYDAFMKEVFAKYSYYHMQCELLWLDLVNDFMIMIQRLQKFACTHRNDFLKEHYNINNQTFLGNHEKVVAELRENKDKNKQLLHQIYEKLKPLHGSRRNRHLLVELQNEMAQTIKQIRSFDINTFMCSYKESQESRVTIFEKELQEADDKLRVLCRESLEELLESPLIKQFDEKLAYMVSSLAEELPVNEEEPVSGVDATYYDKMRALEIPSDYEINLRKVQALQYQDVLDSSYFDDKESMQSNEYFERFNDDYAKLVSVTDDIERTWYTDVDNYEKIFEHSVQKILKLYSVKYDNLPSQ